MTTGVDATTRRGPVEGRRRERAWGVLFVAVLAAVVVQSGAGFARLQAEMAELKRDGPTLIDHKPRRAPGFHLVRRPETSLAGLIESDGPRSQFAQRAALARKGAYEMQTWLRGHEADAPEALGARIGAFWHLQVLVPAHVAPDHPALRPRAGLALRSRIERVVPTPGHRYAFLFDPEAEGALAPGERIVLLAPPAGEARIVYVTSASRLSEIEGLLR